MLLFFKKEDLPYDFFRLEKERYLSRSILGAIGPMHRISLDILRELSAYRAGISLLRIRGAHDPPVRHNGVLATQNLQNDWTRRHERHQAAEERPLAVHAVEFLGLRLAHDDALLRDDAQPGFLELGVDAPGEVPARRIRLDDRKGLFHGHDADPRLAAP